MTKTREILILGLFIIAFCVISLISFSKISKEGYGANNQFGDTGNGGGSGNGSFSFNISGNTNVTSGNTNVTTIPQLTTPFVTTNSPAQTSASPTTNNNTDFINTIIKILSNPPDANSDRVAIYNTQGLVSKLHTQNSATLLGEMSNPNNLTDPRLFLQYMNWFASHCPLDSNTCTGLC
jgi:hypothetical protein